MDEGAEADCSRHVRDRGDDTTHAWPSVEARSQGPNFLRLLRPTGRQQLAYDYRFHKLVLTWLKGADQHHHPTSPQ
jgi:hypothetical protein